MAILKYWNGATWYPLYMDVFSKCLHKGNNLSDLPDIAAARTNLELFGNNVTTHLHDSRYLPLLTTETQERTMADEAEATARTAVDANLQEQINSLKTNILALQSGLAILSGNITIGSAPPETASNDTSIWFDTTNRLIKIYHESAWVPMSAVWL